MIQYQYFHTSAGYVYRMSVGRESPEYFYLENLFQKIRTMTEGDTFTYATLSSGGSLFMQSTNDGKAAFAKGLVVDNMSEYPSKFIGKFETEVENPESIGNTLPEGELPSVSRRALEFPSARVYHDFIPKMVDSIIYGDPKKQLLIVADSREEAEAFLGALGAVLPKKFMSRVGFCIGVKNINNQEIKIPRQNGAPEEVNVKIWLPELMNYRFETFASAFYVFDAKSARENYTAPLSSMARVLQEINLCDVAQVGDFMRCVAGAFREDGSVDSALLETLSSIYLLGIKKDPETARSVLKSSNCSDPTQKLAVVTAINVIMDPANARNVTPADLNDIFDVCIDHNDVMNSIAGNLMEFISHSRESYEALKPEAKSLCIKMIAADTTGGMLQNIYQNWWLMVKNVKDCDSVAIEGFKITCEAMSACFAARDMVHARAASHVIAKAVSFYGMELEQRISAACTERIFNMALELSDTDVRKYAIAVLMSSAYREGTAIEYVTKRIGALKERLHKLSAREQLNLIFDVKDKIKQIGEEIPALGISGVENFLFNCRDGEEWCKSLVTGKGGVKNPLSGSMLEMIELYGQSFNTKYYGMVKIIAQMLLDVDYVKGKLRSGSREHKEYLKFFNGVPEENKSADIKALLNHLQAQGQKSTKNVGAVYEEMIVKFNHLSRSEQEKILARLGITIEQLVQKLGSDENIRRQFTQVVSEYPHESQTKGNKAAALPISVSIISTIAFPLLSLLLMLLPAFFKTAVSDNYGFAARLNSYMHWIALAAVPVVEAGALLATYFLSKNARLKGKRVVIAGILANIPLLIYAIVIIILFMTGVKFGGLI